MRIDVLLTEERLAREFVAALVARSLPEKFFYWFPLSVRAWLDLCAPGEYRNFSRSYSLLREAAADFVGALEPGPVEVVSLGAGGAEKDLLLLDAIRRPGRPARYIAVDASQSLLEVACGAAAGFESRGIKADLTDPEHLGRIRETATETPRLYLVIGNTLGGFDPLEEIRRIAGLLRPGDRVLIDGEIPGPDTMAGYDNPTNRRFASAPLRSIGIGEEDGAVVFEARTDPRLEGLRLIAKHFRPSRDLPVTVSGERLLLCAGERLEMNHSYKYEREAFLRLLLEAGGLTPILERKSPDARFIAVLCRREA